MLEQCVYLECLLFIDIFNGTSSNTFVHNESTLASDNLSKGEGKSVSTSTVSGPSASDDSSRTVTTETLPTIGHGLDQTQNSVGLPSEEMLVDNGSTECEPSDDISCTA